MFIYFNWGEIGGCGVKIHDTSHYTKCSTRSRQFPKAKNRAFICCFKSQNHCEAFKIE